MFSLYRSSCALHLPRLLKEVFSVTWVHLRVEVLIILEVQVQQHRIQGISTCRISRIEYSSSCASRVLNGRIGEEGNLIRLKLPLPSLVLLVN